MKMSRNIYQTARERAGMTQEAASDRLYISTESLRMYETGRRRPSDEMVTMMAELYRDRALAYRHLKTSPAGQILPEVSEQSLEQCAMRCSDCCAILPGEDRVETLLEIAEDGIIDEHERPVYNSIMGDLREIVAASLSLSLGPAQGKKKRLTSLQNR